MPIYEFFCNNCSKTFDKLCSLKDDLSKLRCEYCESQNIKKKMSSFATSGNRDEHDHQSSSSCSSCSSGSCSSCGH
ncbi:MAG TPA: zinc ribbon domain-containing protein [Candidatus Riflebacteria bacterium]|nr:MAG: zinc ribbon domain-containing protein [Candidatus Riflebacteria bacterium HGW-Riflebacteria-1]HAE38097.1 zinc ribbon domain-containing protein [Candidatus Riflebacteria bacterium]